MIIIHYEKRDNDFRPLRFSIPLSMQCNTRDPSFCEVKIKNAGIYNIHLDILCR